MLQTVTSGSPADAALLKAGYLLLRVDGAPVGSAAAAAKAIARAESDVVALLVRQPCCELLWVVKPAGARIGVRLSESNDTGAVSVCHVEPGSKAADAGVQVCRVSHTRHASTRSRASTSAHRPAI